MRDEPLKFYQKVSCLCGTEVRVDPMSQDRRVNCPGCGNAFDFVVTLDASKRKSRLSLILPRGALKPEGETLANTAPPAAPPPPLPPPPVAEEPPLAPKTVTRVAKKTSGKTIVALMGNCECGAAFPLEDNGELTTIQSCPQCNRRYHVVFKIERGTKQKTAMIVPQKGGGPRVEKSRTVAIPKAPKAPTQAPKARAVSVVPAPKARTRVAPKAPPAIPAGAQAVPCTCGSFFVVRRKDVGGEAACESCGRRVRFEEACDPQTLAPVIRIKPR